MPNNKQISSRGIANLSGLDVFSSIINYTGEFINWGNFLAYGNALNSDTNYATTAANPQTDALINSPPSIVNKWYRYRSSSESGSPYTDTDAPDTDGRGVVTFYGDQVGTAISYSGIYQKLEGLTVGKKYEISVQTGVSANNSKMFIQTYTPSALTFELTSSFSFNFPRTGSTLGIQKTTFEAKTRNDIVVIYVNTIEANASTVTALLTSVSIKEEQEYLVQLYANDIFGNSHKVLRLNEGNTISDV